MPRGRTISGEVIEKLVEIIRDRPFIYDASVYGHTDTQKLNGVWDNIAKTLNIPGIDGKGWRAKWRNLRDNYVKEKRMHKEKMIGRAVKIKRKWKYFDLLSFLGPYIIENDYADTNVTMGSDSDEESNSDRQSLNDDVRSSVSCKIEPDSSEIAVSPCWPVNDRNQQKRNVKRSMEDDSSSIKVALRDFIKKSKNSHEHLQVNTERDAEVMLFESYALRLKNLPKETQAFIKLQMSQIFFNAENSDVPPIPITPLPQTNPSHSITQNNHYMDGTQP